MHRTAPPAAEFCARHFERIRRTHSKGVAGSTSTALAFHLRKARHVGLLRVLNTGWVLVWMELPRVMLQLFGEACSSAESQRILSPRGLLL